MSEHLPECWAKHASDPPAWCICDELRACEARVKDEALAWAKAREVNGITWVQAWAQATEACIEAFHDRISDSDLDDAISDDDKNLIATAIRRASLARMKGEA